MEIKKRRRDAVSRRFLTLVKGVLYASGCAVFPSSLSLLYFFVRIFIYLFLLLFFVSRYVVRDPNREAKF